MRWRSMVVALAAVVMLSLTAGDRVAHAEVTNGVRMRCDRLAQGIDGDFTDVTTTDDVDFTCQQVIPPTGPRSVASLANAWAGDDGVFTASDMRFMEASADNVLDEGCTEAVLNCALALITFVNDEAPIHVDPPAALATVEGGAVDIDCVTDGTAFGQDDDCFEIFGTPSNGDGVFITRLLNVSAIKGQYTATYIEQEDVFITYSIPVGLPAGPGDFDFDGVPTALDNCPQWSNSNQTNTDSAVLLLAGAPSDVTIPTADRFGDVCDLDDDNDWLEDQYETAFPMPVSPPGPCVPATAPTLVLNADTDGDRVRDGAECVMGFDPTSAASKPPGIPVGDSDHDGLSDAVEDVIGSDSFDSDSDDDGINDGIEVRGYQSNSRNDNSDNDGCRDDTEIASVNADYVVNSLDLVAIATRFNRRDIAMIDVTKDGIINSLDLVIVAKSFDPTPCA